MATESICLSLDIRFAIIPWEVFSVLFLNFQERFNILNLVSNRIFFQLVFFYSSLRLCVRLEGEEDEAKVRVRKSWQARAFNKIKIVNSRIGAAKTMTMTMTTICVASVKNVGRHFLCRRWRRDRAHSRDSSNWRQKISNREIKAFRVIRSDVTIFTSRNLQWRHCRHPQHRWRHQRWIEKVVFLKNLKIIRNSLFDVIPHSIDVRQMRQVRLSRWTTTFLATHFTTATTVVSQVLFLSLIIVNQLIDCSLVNLFNESFDKNN